MKIEYTKPKKAIYKIIIYGDGLEDKNLVEDYFDEETRSTCKLRSEVINWLNENAPGHEIDIDRGDFGEGTEHFHIRFDTQSQADAFQFRFRDLAREDLLRRSMGVLTGFYKGIANGPDLLPEVTEWLREHAPECEVTYEGYEPGKNADNDKWGPVTRFVFKTPDELRSFQNVFIFGRSTLGSTRGALGSDHHLDY